jgi:eukaryotic-like serine/threonine-protein kinase
MLTQSGAKLMDFGLAKPVGLQTATAASGAPPSFTAAATLSGPSPLSPLTTAGTIIGTIQYMSPEQIEGKEADTRSDIFAFGAVLYEMATGKRPFEGKSQISLASSILEKDPEPISVLKPVTPPAFEHVVTTCLQKIPDDRFQTAHDVKLELQWIAAGKAPAAAPISPSHQRERMVWAIALLVALVLGGLGGFLARRPEAPAHAIRTVINAPEKTTLNLSGDNAGPPVVSPDGTFVAFTATGADGKTTIWVRPMNSTEAHALNGTENATFPFWSPDGRSLGFFADNKLKVVDVNDSSVQALQDSPLGRGGTWGPGGLILYSPSVQSPITRVSASGGDPVAVTKIDPNLHTSHRWPFFLPDGKHFLYSAIHHDPSKAANNGVYWASLDGRENRELFRSKTNAIYAGGFLLFLRGDQLMAQPFDPGNGTLSGEPQSVAKGVIDDNATWHMGASASANGLLVFGSGGSGDLQLVWVDRNTKQVSVIGEKLANLYAAVLSPQGDRVALQIDMGVNDIWVLDLARGVRTRLTFGPIANQFPVWSPDGQWIAYESNRNGKFHVLRKHSDGSGAEEVLLSDEPQMLTDDWSRDGKYLIYSKVNLKGVVTTRRFAAELWALPLEGEERKPFQVVEGGDGRLSPDGHWLAYVSGESGDFNVYVVPFGGGQGKWQVSANGGSRPQWSKDGKTLYYMDSSYKLYAVPVRTNGGALQFGSTQMIWDNTVSAPQIFYDIAPDGKRILTDRVSQQVNQSVTVVSNFTAELNSRH